MNRRTNKKIGIVIVHFGDPKHVERLLTSISKSVNLECSVYIVDNSSNGLIKKYIIHSKLRRRISYIDPKDNLGWARGANLGAKIAIKKGCGKLCFLTSDTVVRSRMFFSELAKPLDNEHVGITLPVVVYYNQPETIWMSGGRFYTLLMLAKLLNNNKPVSLAKHNIKPDFGGICMMRSGVFKKLKGWNESYFLYYEDVDLGFKIKKIKKRIVLVSDSIIAHKVSTPSSNRETLRLSPKSAYFYGRGSLIFIKGNLRGVVIIIAFCSQIFIQVPMFILAMTRQSNLKALIAYFKGSLVGLSILLK